MKAKKIIVCILAALLLSISLSFQVSAAMIFEYEGYSYSYINNYNVSLVGWDDRSPSLVVPDTINDRKVFSIGNYALAADKEITSVVLSEVHYLDRIGMGAFQECSNIDQEIVFPECLKTINTCAFQDCTSLPSVIDNSQVSEIPDQCFYNCTSLRTVVLNDNLHRIGYYAFANCGSLERVDIPRSVTEIGTSSFQNDDNLVLGVYYDTVGHQYAVNNRIDHMVLDRQSGDVNGDGSVDVFDATEIQKYAAEKMDFTDEQFELGDINKDGYVDVMDALLVQKSVVGKYDIPPIIVRY